MKYQFIRAYLCLGFVVVAFTYCHPHSSSVMVNDGKSINKKENKADASKEDVSMSDEDIDFLDSIGAENPSEIVLSKTDHSSHLNPNGPLPIYEKDLSSFIGTWRYPSTGGNYKIIIYKNADGKIYSKLKNWGGDGVEREGFPVKIEKNQLMINYGGSYSIHLARIAGNPNRLQYDYNANQIEYKYPEFCSTVERE